MKSEDQSKQGWFGETTDVFCRHWRLLLAGAFVQQLLPVTAAALVFLFSYQNKVACIGLGATVFSVGWLWLQAGYVRLVLKVCRNQDVGLLEMFISPAILFGFSVVVFCLYLASMLGAAFLIIPGIWLFSRLCLAPVVVVETQRGIRQSLSESMRLTKDAVWGIACLVTVFAVAALIAIFPLFPFMFINALFWTSICVLYLRLNEEQVDHAGSCDQNFVTKSAVITMMLLVSCFSQTLLEIGCRQLVQPRHIEGNWMGPALRPDTKVLFESVSKLLHAPLQRGDVLLYYPPPSTDDGEYRRFSLLKVLGTLTGFGLLPFEPASVCRVIALPGETVEVRKDEGVFINGEFLDESSYTPTSPNFDLGTDSRKPIVIPPGQVFMLFDDRESTDDSNSWVFLDQKRIIGKQWLVLFRLNRSTH